MLKKIPVLATLLIIPLLALTQQDTTRLFPEVEVSEKRISNIPFIAATRNIRVISNEELLNLPVQTLSEAISLIAGIDLRQRGAFGAQGDVSIMGSTFDQILVLIDGIPMRDAQTGHNQLNLPVDVSQIERIEMLSGSACRIYGANALAGAINIVTKAPGSENLSLQVFGGSPLEGNDVKSTPFGLGGVRISGGLKSASGKSGHQLDASLFRTDGYRYNSANTQQRLNYRGSYSLGKGQLKIQSGTVLNSFGANGYYAYPVDTEAEETVETTYGGMKYEQKIGEWSIKPAVYFRYNHDDYIFIRQKPEVYRNQHYTTSAGIEINASKQNKAGQLGVGYESRSEIIRSNNLGRHERYYHGFYAEQQFIGSNGGQIIAGALAQYNTQFGFKLYPGLEFSAPITPVLRAFGHLALGSRLPTFTDLYYSDSRNLGNDQLEPEEAFSGEAGIRYNTEKMRVSLSGLYRRTADFIDYTRMNESEKWVPQNFQVVDHRGFDFSFQYQFQASERKISPVMFRSNFTLLDGAIADQQGFSKYSLNHLRYQFNTLFILKTGRSIQHTFFFRYHERIEGNSFGILDYRIQYKFKHFLVAADVTNILDKTYIESGFITMPGQWYRLSLAFKL